MSGECEECGEHCLECSCKQKRPESITPKWIEVNSATPDAGKRVLGTDGVWVEIVWNRGAPNGERSWSSLSLMILDVTHWMELPNVPQKEEE